MCRGVQGNLSRKVKNKLEAQFQCRVLQEGHHPWNFLSSRRIISTEFFALLVSFHRFSPSRRLSAALRAHRRFDVLLAVLVPVLLYFVLLVTTDSLAVVPSRILITCSLAVVPSLILSRDTLG